MRIILHDTPLVKTIPESPEIMKRIMDLPEHQFPDDGPRSKPRDRKVLPNGYTRTPGRLEIAKVGLSETMRLHCGKAIRVPTAYYMRGCSSNKEHNDRWLYLEPILGQPKDRLSWRVYIIKGATGCYTNLGTKNGAVLIVSLEHFNKWSGKTTTPRVVTQMSLRTNRLGGFDCGLYYRADEVTFEWYDPETMVRVIMLIKGYFEIMKDGEVDEIRFTSASVGFQNLTTGKGYQLYPIQEWETMCPGLVLDMNKEFPFELDETIMGLMASDNARPGWAG